MNDENKELARYLNRKMTEHKEDIIEEVRDIIEAQDLGDYDENPEEDSADFEQLEDSPEGEDYEGKRKLKPTENIDSHDHKGEKKGKTEGEEK